MSNQQPPQDDLVQLAELARLQAEVADAEAQAALAKAAAARLQVRALELEAKLRPAQPSITTVAPITGGLTPGHPQSGSARHAQPAATTVTPVTGGLTPGHPPTRFAGTPGSARQESSITADVNSAGQAANGKPPEAGQRPVRKTPTSRPSKIEVRATAVPAPAPVEPELSRTIELPKPIEQHVKNGNGSATRVPLAPAESTSTPPSPTEPPTRRTGAVPASRLAKLDTPVPSATKLKLPAVPQSAGPPLELSDGIDSVAGDSRPEQAAVVAAMPPSQHSADAETVVLAIAKTAPPEVAPTNAVTGEAQAKPQTHTQPNAADEGEKTGSPRFGLPPRVLRMSVAVTSSMFVHLALIVALGLWFLPQIIKSQANELVATLPETPEDMVNQLLDERLTATDALSLVSASPSSSSQIGQAGQGGESGGVVGPGEPTFDKTVAESGEGPPVNATVTLDSFEMPGGTLNEQVSDLALGEPLAVVDNYQEAMDRITQEILNMLSKNKVLVIWCFDQSLSMKDDQKEIRERIAKVYAELGLAESAKGDALLTAVTSFGKTPMENMRDPTSDIERIKAAIESVPVDESGLEMMCQAVHDSIQQYRRFASGGRRQIALILVSDESGDEKSNLANLEETIAMAKQYRCPVYVLGREAVFGYPYAHMWWTVTVPAQGGGMASNPYLVAVDRGPESPFVEQLQTDGFGRRQDAHPSGFGPYDQVRLARETGGIFFMLPSPESQLFNRDNRKYEIERMRPYLPDLRARDIYTAERDSKPLRSGVWRVINDLNPYHEVQGKYINMRMTFSIDRPAFAREVLIELEKAKQYFLYLDMVEKRMEEMRRARDQDASPRWQANYDLMFAQILAYKVRLYEYGAYLQEFIKQPRLTPPNEPKKALIHWAIVTRQETITGETTRSYIQRSKAMFEEVVRYHPGTPWAARAQWEIQRGFGVELVPQFYDPTYKPPVPLKPFVAPKL